jgi:hypothetical protein
MFSALLSPLAGDHATLCLRRWFHFFPMATARCNADEQIFIFAPKFSVRPHPEEPRSGVSKDESPDAAAGPHGSPGDAKHRPETALSRLLTMRASSPAGVAPKQKVLQSFQADLPRPVLREKRIRFARDPNHF